MITAKLRITREDIRVGIKCKGTRCPTALALQRVFGPYVGINVHKNRTELYKIVADDKVEVFIATNSSTLQAWIQNFDGGYYVDPIEAELDFVVQE